MCADWFCIERDGAFWCPLAGSTISERGYKSVYKTDLGDRGRGKRGRPRGMVVVLALLAHVCSVGNA